MCGHRADASAEMLARARGKDSAGEVTWDRQDAGCLTYPDGRFDVVFLSHLLHHVGCPQTVIAECHRVLRPAGTVLVRYGAMEQIRSDVEHALFPGVLAIDEARTPSVADTEGWLRAAGFEGVTSLEVVQETYADGQAHLRAASAKSTSVLTMIPGEAFAHGLRQLEEHVRRRPDDPWLRLDRMTLTSGRKHSGPGR